MKTEAWFSPEESTDALELIKDAKETFEQLAKYAPMRKELRGRLEARARELNEFLQRGICEVMDSSLLLAVQAIADRRKVSVFRVMVDALETYVSKVNRSA